MTTLALRRALREDDAYQKYRNILKMAVKTSTFASLVEEMETLHKGRKSRHLFLRPPSIEKTLDAAMQDSAYRSRCVEIVVIVSKTQRMLTSSVDSISNIIVAKYSHLMKELRTKGERDAAIASLLQPAYDKLAEIESIIEIAQYVIEDIDKTAWSYKTTVEGLKLMYDRENVVKIT